MTTTRERLERRWTPGRIVLLVVAIVVALLVVVAGLALWWLPPVLAETPRERFAAPTRVTVQDAAGSAGVEVAEGWVPLGVGPFLAADEATLVSPDGVYRAELAVVALPEAGGDSVLAALLERHDLEGQSAPPPTGAPGGAATAGAATATASAAGGVRWSEEALTSGVTVRYADFTRGSTTYTVALLTPTPTAPDASPAASGITSAIALTLVATAPAADAPRYRTVTADLAASATFTPAPATTTAPPPTGGRQ